VKTKATVIKQVNAIKRRIASERDKLRSLIEELEAIEFAAIEAVDSLESAADSLSEYL